MDENRTRERHSGNVSIRQLTLRKAQREEFDLRALTEAQLVLFGSTASLFSHVSRVASTVADEPPDLQVVRALTQQVLLSQKGQPQVILLGNILFAEHVLGASSARTVPIGSRARWPQLHRFGDGPKGNVHVTPALSWDSR